MGTAGRGEVVRLARSWSRLRVWSNCSGSTRRGSDGGHAGDQRIGLLGWELAAGQVGGA